MYKLSISSRLEIDYILCCISSNKRPKCLLNFERLLEAGAYFKDRKINNIKRQNFVIFSFKIEMKHKFSLSMNHI